MRLRLYIPRRLITFSRLHPAFICVATGTTQKEAAVVWNMMGDVSCAIAHTPALSLDFLLPFCTLTSLPPS